MRSFRRTAGLASVVGGVDPDPETFKIRCFIVDTFLFSLRIRCIWSLFLGDGGILEISFS